MLVLASSCLGVRTIYYLCWLVVVFALLPSMLGLLPLINIFIKTLLIFWYKLVFNLETRENFLHIFPSPHSAVHLTHFLSKPAQS